ncbi:MAG TPA: NRDE family protein [Pseudomonadota bacterium]|nr:NRDE family protein [Pseudomonadota bacterium]
MCTVIVGVSQSARCPLWIAANRDEFLSRPSAAPTLSRETDLTMLAPTDLVAGGTWIGANSAGLVAAVTNRFGTLPDRTKLSRGELVRRALRHRSTESAIGEIAALPPSQYNPFHVIVASRAAALLVIHTGAALVTKSLDCGVHVITERSFGTGPAPREIWIRQQLDKLDPQARADSAHAASLLRSHHDSDPFGSVCIHAPDRGYGTRSSSTIELHSEPNIIRYGFAEGPPCETDYVMQSLPLEKTEAH